MPLTQPVVGERVAEAGGVVVPAAGEGLGAVEPALNDGPAGAVTWIALTVDTGRTTLRRYTAGSVRAYDIDTVTSPRRLRYRSRTVCSKGNKKFELMLTRRAQAYNSSCSQIAVVHLQPFCRSLLLKCAVQPKIAKKDNETSYFGVQSLSKSSMLIRLKSSSLGLVVIGSISMHICNSFYSRLDNNGKITTFIG